MSYLPSPRGSARRFRPTTSLRGALGDTCARMAVSIDGTQNECIDASGNVISSTPIPGATPYASSGGSSSSSSSNPIWGVIGGLFGNALRPNTPGAPYPAPSGLDTTTLLLLGGVGIFAVYMISKD